MLVEEFELGVLWDEYGLVGDIVVHPFLFCIFTINLHGWEGHLYAPNLYY